MVSGLDEDLTAFTDELRARNYEIDRVIGSGGMGTVYHGRHLRLGRDVAVKVLSRNLAADARAQGRFVNEMAIMAKINHPAVVNIYDGDISAQGVPYFVMEYVNGPSLAELMARRPTLYSPRDVARMLMPVAHALDFLHDIRALSRDPSLPRRIVHRDVKPANIILSPSGPKLTDFGISYSHDDTRMTSEGNFVGTVAYTAPELFRGSRDPRGVQPGPQSDNYALALIALEMMTGVRLQQTMSEVAWRGDRPLDFLDTVPAARVLRTALANDPQDRFDSAAAFIQALGEADGKHPGSSRVLRRRGTPRKRRTTLTLAATASVAVAGLGALALGQFTHPAWDADAQRIAEAFPQLVADRVNGTGWMSTRCTPGEPSTGQKAVVHCNGLVVSFSVADYGSAEKRALYPVEQTEALESPRCVVEQAQTDATTDTWAVLPSAPRERYLVLLIGPEATDARLSIPIC